MQLYPSAYTLRTPLEQNIIARAAERVLLHGAEAVLADEEQHARRAVEAVGEAELREVIAVGGERDEGGSE